MTIENFNHTIDYWIEELERYTFIQLCARQSPNSWSLGQMYRHLIDDANFYVEQIKMCVMNNDHAIEEATAHGKMMLHNNDFPNEIIEGSPNNAFIPQPENKEQLMNDLLNLKTEMNTVAALISES